MRALLSHYPTHTRTHARRDALATEMRDTKKTLDASRPTAVNLMWATARIVEMSDALAKVPSMTVATMAGT